MSTWRILLLAMAVAACGVPEGGEVCGPSTCDGCCTATGHCVSATAAACGVRGAACVTCPPSMTCRGGACAAAVTMQAPPDAGAPRDAGAFDAGVPTDAGLVLDAGAPDAGPSTLDAGAPDAGGPRCAPSRAMPPNQALDGDFECGGALPFTSSGGGGQVTRVPGRSGSGLRFTVAAGLFNNEFSSTWRFQVVRAGTFCARAFVRGTATAVSMRLYLGPPGTAAGEMFDMPGPWATWSRLPPTLAAVSVPGQAGDEGFLVFSDTTRTPGATIEVDDVDVWRSDDGSCRETR